jgi:hypothetical protein
LLLLLAVLALVLRTEQAQTWIGGKAIAYLNSTYGTQISVAKVRLELPNLVHIQAAYSPDDTGDTLAFIQEASIRIRKYDRAHNLLHFGLVKAKDVKLLMRIHPEDTLFNFARFLALFDSERDTTRPLFRLEVDDFSLEGITYDKLHVGCQGCTNIRLRNATLKGRNLLLFGMEVGAEIAEMTYRDLDRFDLNQFYGKAKWTPELVTVDSIAFETDFSKVAFKGIMQTDSLGGYRKFLDLAQITGRFYRAEVSSREFQEWIPQFPDFSDFRISGWFDGTVNDFSAKGVDVMVGHSVFSGDVALRDCTNPEQLYLDASVRRLVSDYLDVERFVWQFLPSPPDYPIEKLGRFQLAGDYKGTIKDFEVNGTATGTFGKVLAAATLSNLGQADAVGYEGRFQFEDLDLKLLTDETFLGPVSGGGLIKGIGLTRERLRALVDFRFNKFTLNGYPITNLNLNGFVEDRAFDGRLTARDPNLDLDFQGSVGFKTEDLTMNFSAKLHRADLMALNISKDSVSILAANADINFTNDSVQDWLGVVLLDNISFHNSRRHYFFNAIKLKSSVSGRGKEFLITSDLLDASVRGTFEIEDLVPVFQAAIHEIYPHYPHGKEWPDVVADLDLKLKDAGLVFDLLTPGFYASSNTLLKLKLDGKNKSGDLRFYAPELQIQKHKFIESSLDFSGKFGALKGSQQTQLYQYGNIRLDSLELRFVQQNRTILYDFSSLAREASAPEFNLSGSVAFEAQNQTSVMFKESAFDISGFHFEIDDGNEIRLFDKRVEVSKLRITQDAGFIALEGIISGNPFEVLRITLKDMTVGIFDELLDIPSLRFDGLFNGELIGSDLFSAPKFAAILQIDSLEINRQWLGDLTANANWDLYENMVNLSGNATRGTRQTLSYNGIFYPGKDNSVFLDARLNRFRLAFLEPVFGGILSDLRGAVNGTFVMEGPILKPQFDGQFTLDQVGMKVPYLNTQYVIQGSPQLQFTESRIFWEDVPIRESSTGTSGVISGLVGHKRLSDFTLNIRVEAENLLALDTDPTSENYFYGRAFAKGNVDILGPVENIQIRMNATSVGNTKIHIPLDNPLEVSQQRFINFVGASQPEQKDSSVYSRVEGLNLDLVFNMTPDAEVELQLDPDAGGTISGRGTGRIRLTMDESGELEMFGNYEIATGNYQFMLQRLVNKPFKVAPGSTISWNGDPFNAILDIRATYNTRTTLNGVVTNPSYPGNRVNVDLDLLLKGNLMDTEISFDIKLPQSDPAFQEELNSRFSNSDQLNEQAFSLLVYNSFFDATGGAGGGLGNLAGTALGANAMQGLSAQFSNFLNKGTGDLFDINVAYNPGGINTAADPLLASQEEVAIDVSRQFFDDRVVINSVFDVPVGANPNRLAGNVSVEYKITPDGRIRTRFFNRSNLDNPYVDQLAPYSQGIGIFYRKDFDKFSLGETFRRIVARKEDAD